MAGIKRPHYVANRGLKETSRIKGQTIFSFEPGDSILFYSSLQLKRGCHSKLKSFLTPDSWSYCWYFITEYLQLRQFCTKKKQIKSTHNVYILSESGTQMMTPFPVPIQSLLQAAINEVMRTKENPSLPVPSNK